MPKPKDIKYAKTHEWVAHEGAEGDLITVGISNHAQELLGDIVFVELPEVGRSVELNESIAVIESVKAASDIYAPMAGTVESVNEALEAEPTLVNSAPYEAGWLFKIRIGSASEDTGHLVDFETYQKDYIE